MATPNRGKGHNRDGEGSSQAKRKHITSPSPSKDDKPLSVKETSLEAVKFLLDAQVVVQDIATSNVAPAVFSGAGGRALGVVEGELPVDERDMKKFRSLFVRCSSRELDALMYCVGCFNRASQRPHSTWSLQVWTPLSLYAQEVATSTALQQLVDGATRHGEDDLWSSLYGAGGHQSSTIAVSFLEHLSGWSVDGIQVPLAMLQKMTTMAKETSMGKRAIVQLVKAAGSFVRRVEKPDEILVKCGKLFDGLDVLFSDPIVAEIVSASLLDEVQKGVQKLGDYFEKSSVLAGLFSVTTMMPVNKLHPLMLRAEKYSCFCGLRNFPNFSWVDAINCHTHIQDGLHRCQKTVHAGLLKMLKSSNRTNTLAWMSAMVSLNELRAGPRFRKKDKMEGVCSDGFMLNFCAVLLELCKPFFSNHPSAQKLALISSEYPSSPLCRLDLHNEMCLAHGIIGNETRLSKAHERFLSQGSSSPGGAPFKFVTECFFITQRALHVGLITAVNGFSQTMSDLNKQAMAKVSGGNDKLLKELSTLYMLCCTCCLMDPQFVQYCSEFYITQAVWLTKQMESCREDGVSEEEVGSRQRKLLAGVPDYCVKDMCIWFRFVVLSKPVLLQGLQLIPFVDCCVNLLERPDLLPSPLAQSRIVSVLLAFVNSDKRGPQAGRLLRSEGWGGILGELSVMVQASPTVQDKLGPALLHTYAAVSVVEGLDVDKENFDKYSTRFEIAQLLNRLWSRPDCRDSILKECGGKKFQAYLGAIFDTLLYQLNDALSRLMNVRKYETAKDGGQWNALSDKDRREKEVFLVSEQQVSRGFMTQANMQMELLAIMSESELVAKCLCVPPLAKRTAAAMLGFLDALCGPKASELKVKDMEKYAFDPRRLLVQIASIMIRVWKQDKTSTAESSETFLMSLATHPDFENQTMSKCGSVLQKQVLSGSDVLGDYTSLMQQVERIQSQTASSASSPSIHQSPAASPGGKQPGYEEWQKAIDSEKLDEDALRDVYISALEVSKYDSAVLEDVHTLADKAQVTLDARSPKVKAILRDMKQLEESAPIHPDSTIFIRQDEDHMDLVRVLITGPTETPYSRGCFVFDIYFPVSYPTNPPLVVMTTTGGGTIRFNPNLYADGKVCLSLLGTWHGGDATEKWDPLRSNILQVLLSIQGMIFIPDPMFNEPGYERIQGTEEGKVRSRQYNADIQVHTVRYAMLEQLRNPPTGFEDLIPVHFAIQRDAILQQCSKWLKEAVSPEHERRLRKAVNELRELMDKM